METQKTDEKTETWKPKKQVWRIDCLMCETTKTIGISKVGNFLIRPTVICGKCRSVCTVELD